MTAEAARLAVEGEFAIMVTPWLLFPLKRAFRDAGDGPIPDEHGTPAGVRGGTPAQASPACARRLMGHVLDAVGENVDVVKIGDDLGTQQSLLMSPATYRAMLKPLHAELIASIRRAERTRRSSSTRTATSTPAARRPRRHRGGHPGSHPDVRRQDGRSRDPEAPLRRRPDVLRRDRYPAGPPRTGRRTRSPAEVRRVIGELAPGGGYLLSSVHTIMNDVPAENILAMVDEAMKVGRYPIRA